MNWIYRILICVVIATVSSAIYFATTNNLDASYQIDTTTAVWFSLTCLLSMILTHLRIPASTANSGTNNHRSKKKTASNGRESGEVKWFNGGKGFGFISCDNGDEIFVHFRSVRTGSARLSPGKRVEFSIGQGKKGDEAEDVAVLD